VGDKKAPKNTNRSVTNLLLGLIAIAAIAIGFLFPKGQPAPAASTKPTFDKVAVDECLATAKQKYDEEVADWNRSLEGGSPRHGTIDPFKRAKEYYDGNRYDCYRYFGVDIPKDLHYIRDQA
jgi:hypothetical protein